VGAAAMAALVPHAARGHIRWRTGLLFGGAGMVGAHLGGRVSGLLPEGLILAGFAAMMVATAVALLRCRRCDEAAMAVRGDGAPPSSPPLSVPSSAPSSPERRARVARLLGQGFTVGGITGIVGVGGGFLIVPALSLLARVPTQAAVGTSLLIIVLNAAAGVTGHAAHLQLNAGLATSLALACATGSVAGGLLANRVPQRRLRQGFAVMVLLLVGIGAVTRAAVALRS